MLRSGKVFVMVLMLVGASLLRAQDEDKLIVTGVSPESVPAAQSVIITVTGSHFSEDSQVNLLGFGALMTQFDATTQLRATMPDNVPGGTYSVEVSDHDQIAVMNDAITVLQDEPPIMIESSEPRRVTAGSGTTLTILGSNFTSSTVVRVVGFGVLETTLVDSTTLRATLAANIPTGQYDIEVRDPQRGSATLSNALRVVAAPQPPTEAPPPTEIPLPTETLPPPTPIPGQPSLIVSSFMSNPEVILPGGTATLSFTVVNQGNRTAEGVSVALDPSGNFVPAPGQAGMPLPNLLPGGAYSTTLTVRASSEAPDGPVTVPLVFTYRDFSGETYTSQVELSVRIQKVDRVPLVNLDNYAVNPDPAVPGQPVTVRATLSNTGNEVASQVTVRITGSENLLLAGGQGDTFTVGEIQPGATVPVEMYMVVSRSAEAGPQPQAFTINYLQSGEVQTKEGSITIPVAQVEVPEALLLLASYETGQEILKPGDRFTLSIQLRNVGDADAANLLLTFGTVETSGDGGGSSDGTGGGTMTTTSVSTDFAPLGTGGRLFLGAIPAGSISDLIEQDFIVSGSVQSGIYNLPLTLSYQKRDGSNVQETLFAGVVVIVPPRMQITLDSPLPESVNVGEPLAFSLTLFNAGGEQVDFTNATVAVNNGEVLEGAQTPLNPLNADDDTTVSAVVLPMDEGNVEIVVTLFYIDDLNHEQTLVETYQTAAMLPPPPPEDVFEPAPVVEEPVEEDQRVIERLLLGLLGLGSE